MILRWKTIQATATREEKVIDAISISLWESEVLSNSDPPILISHIPHSKDHGRFRVIQLKYGNVRKSHLIEEFLKTTFSMNSKDLDYRLTPLAVDITMEGASHSFGTCGRGFTP